MTEQTKLTKHSLLKGRVKLIVDGSNERVMNNVVEAIALPIMEKRKNLLIKGLDEIDKAMDERKKIKPDIVEFSADGEGQPTGIKSPGRYSEALAKKATDLDNRIKSLHEAFNKALTKTGTEPDYRPLENLVGKEKS